MTAIKQIQMIVTPPPAHYVGDGFRVHQIIPGAIARTQERMDPFLMLDYNAPFYFSPSEVSRGVGAHPHK
jgi:redox-sensitive bicupin YhaK (pirin superfamily)